MERLLEREKKRQRRGEASVAYDASVLARWMQLLGRHAGLYNVNNSHQCFNNNNNDRRTLRPASITRPFEAVPEFYGCTLCGRYHFCRAERESCEIHYSESERCEICLYSGRALRLQDNLEADEYDERLRCSIDRQTADDSASGHSYVRGGRQYIPRGVKEKQEEEEGKGLEGLLRSLKRKKDEEERQLKALVKGEGDEEVEEKMLIYEAGEDEIHDENNSEEERRTKDNDEIIGFQKNYHNNLQYNNELFEFLWPALLEEAAPPPKQASLRELYGRDIQSSTGVRTKPTTTTPTAVLVPMSVEETNKIRDEVELIVTRLLTLQRAAGNGARRGPHCVDSLSRSLVQYYSHLCGSIASLIHSRSSNTVLEPQRLVQALMYFLLLQPLAFNDAMGNRVEVWYRDPWLHHVMERHVDTTVRQEQRARLKPTNEAIVDSLVSYSWCPLWLRATLFPP